MKKNVFRNTRRTLGQQLSENETLVSRVGRLLVAARFRRKWTQAQLAENAGMHQAQIARIENGSRSTNLNVLERLAEALDMRFAVTLGGISSPNAQHFEYLGKRRRLVLNVKEHKQRPLK